MNRTANIIAEDIRNWDRQDICRLRDLIKELSKACENPQVYINMSSLPSANIPSDIDTSYPVWAVDLQGVALVGDGADDIEEIEEVRASQMAHRARQ